VEDGFQHALILGDDEVPAAKYRVGSVPARRRRSGRLVFLLVAAVLFVMAAAMGLAFNGRRSVRSPATALAAPLPRAHHPVEIAAFVVPNSATDKRWQEPFPPGPPQVRGALAEHRTRSAGTADRTSTGDDSLDGPGASRRLLPARAVAMTGARTVDDRVVAAKLIGAGQLASARPQKPVDCRPSFEFDEQGRRHFTSGCAAARPAIGASSARTSSACSPSFELDEQGRKHFKPECFLKGN
jgi:hypothetical protein